MAHGSQELRLGLGRLQGGIASISQFLLHLLAFGDVSGGGVEQALLGRRSRIPDDWSGETVFADRDLAQFNSDGEAYHQLIRDLVVQQYVSTNLVLHDQTVKRIFVDGGFSKNELYMNLLAQAFAGREVYATSIAQASSLGAALAIHHAWNPNPVPSEIIELKYYSAVQFKSQN